MDTIDARMNQTRFLSQNVVAIILYHNYKM